jgi:hypothetical protein
MKTMLHLSRASALFIGISLMVSNHVNAQLAYHDGRVSFNPESALILPIKPTICPNSEGVELVANVTDVDNTYTYVWSGPSKNGARTKSIIATEPGEYSVSVWAGSEIPFAILTTTVKLNATVSMASPGEDLMLCYSGEIQIALDAEVSGNATWVWQGGEGVFVTGRQDLTGTYIPSEDEIYQGFVELTLVPTVSTGCEVISKPLHIEIKDFEASASVVIRHASHENASDASIEFSFVGGATPFTYQWSHGATTPYVSGLKSGEYHVKITDANGCEAWSNVMITNISDLK